MTDDERGPGTTLPAAPPAAAEDRREVRSDTEGPAPEHIAAPPAPPASSSRSAPTNGFAPRPTNTVPSPSTPPSAELTTQTDLTPSSTPPQHPSATPQQAEVEEPARANDALPGLAEPSVDGEVPVSADDVLSSVAEPLVDVEEPVPADDVLSGVVESLVGVEEPVLADDALSGVAQPSVDVEEPVRADDVLSGVAQPVADVEKPADAASSVVPGVAQSAVDESRGGTGVVLGQDAALVEVSAEDVPVDVAGAKVGAAASEDASGRSESDAVVSLGKAASGATAAAEGSGGGSDGDPGGSGGGSGDSGEPDGAGEKKKQGSFWKELPVLIGVALVLALVIKAFAVQAFYIPSASMESTLQIGDRVLVNKMVYRTRDITRGDIVVFSGIDSWDPEIQVKEPSNPVSKLVRAVGTAFGVVPGEKDYIKRVIGIPGDRVKCCEPGTGRITVNGKPLDERSYLYTDPETGEQNIPSDKKFEITVPEDRLWVMGDHRDVSYDSRGHSADKGQGTIPTSSVVGRAFVVVWPVTHAKVLNIPDTFNQPGLAAALPYTPLALGFIAAVPITLLQRRLRHQLTHRA